MNGWSIEPIEVQISADEFSGGMLNEHISGRESARILCALLSFMLDEKSAGEGAKRLLEKFGSVSSVMDAPINDIAHELNGNVSAARLLTLIPTFSKGYFLDKVGGGRRFGSVDELAQFCVYKFFNDRRESYQILMFDSSASLLGIEEVTGGSGDHVCAELEKLGDALFRYGAKSFALVHNHPGIEPYPSESDVRVTERIYALTAPFGKILSEHLIISGNKYIPILQLLRANGYDFYTY